MTIEMFKAKIQRPKITEAELKYEGSLTVDQDLLDAAGMLPHEKVQVVNVNNGNRIETYLISGERGSGTICLNGAAARCGMPGDEVIIITYCSMSPEEAKTFTPTVVIVNAENKIVEVRK